MTRGLMNEVAKKLMNIENREESFVLEPGLSTGLKTEVVKADPSEGAADLHDLRSHKKEDSK